MKASLVLTLTLVSVLVPMARDEDVVILQFEKRGALLPPIVIEMYDADAPKHAANFKKLADNGFYRNTSIHRVLTGALLQMGDPLSREKNSIDIGTGGPGYTIAPEIRRKHMEASVGMGRLPDKINPSRLSNGSQFYITLKPLPELDGTQTVFGRVTKGLEVLQDIGKSSTDTNDMPVEKIVIRRSKVVPKETLETSLKSFQPGKTSFWNRVSGIVPKLF